MNWAMMMRAQREWLELVLFVIQLPLSFLTRFRYYTRNMIAIRYICVTANSLDSLMMMSLQVLVLARKCKSTSCMLRWNLVQFMHVKLTECILFITESDACVRSDQCLYNSNSVSSSLFTAEVHGNIFSNWIPECMDRPSKYFIKIQTNRNGKERKSQLCWIVFFSSASLRRKLRMRLIFYLTSVHVKLVIIIIQTIVMWSHWIRNFYICMHACFWTIIFLSISSRFACYNKYRCQHVLAALSWKFFRNPVYSPPNWRPHSAKTSNAQCTQTIEQAHVICKKLNIKRLK